MSEGMESWGRKNYFAVFYLRPQVRCFYGTPENATPDIPVVMSFADAIAENVVVVVAKCASELVRLQLGDEGRW